MKGTEKRLIIKGNEKNKLTGKANLTRQRKILGDCYVVTLAHKT